MIPPADILQRIDAFTLATEKDEMRDWLGASEVGEKCVRRLYYSFRWCGAERFDGRMLRLFARGHREEPELRRLLTGAGFTFVVPQSKHEFGFSDISGHFRGTADDVGFPPGEDDPVLFEYKTYAEKRFLDLKRLGVKENDPKYYSQAIVYLGELSLTKCLFCAVNKNSDELYFQWIDFDPVHFNACLNKAEAVINATTPPERISNNKDTFTCRYCPFNQICHENSSLPVSNHHCRNCKSASPAPEGQWVCQKGHTFGEVCKDYHFVG